jgi:hypothetical protein
MARGITFDDFVYEVDDGNVDTPAIVSTMYIRMDKFNVGTADTKIKKSNTLTPAIPAHVLGHLNEKEFGVHPRLLLCEHLYTATDAQCYGFTPKRLIYLPVLTLAQFTAFNVYKKGATTQAAKSTVSICHSRDGKTNLTYNIIKKIPQVNI